MIKEIMFKWQDLEAKYMDKSWQYAEGEERGLEKGRAEGRAEGKREILFALLKVGAEVRLLKEVSGLSEEEIVALRKEIK